jgi:hypothetical protein
VFPGAAPDTAARQEWGDPGPGQEVKLYSTSAPIEDVFRFYRSQLAATQSQGGMADPRRLRAGEATPAVFDVGFHESLPDNQAAALRSRRKPYDNGQWIANAAITWVVKGSGSEVSSHTVQIEDRSFDNDRYAQKTLIVIQREGGSIPPEESGAGGSSGSRGETSRDALREERRSARRQQAAVAPPAAQELGAPLYPGAVFDGNASASLAQPGAKVFIYFSTEVPDTVVAFYRSRLGVQTTRDSDGRHMIPLRGGLPLPDWGIEIMPNLLFDKKYKTVITFASWTVFKGK